MASKTSALSILFMYFLSSLALPPTQACGYCNHPPYSRTRPPISTRPPYVKRPPKHTNPPVITPPVIVNPPPVVNPPNTGGSPPTGGLSTPPSSGGGGGLQAGTPGKCSIDALKLGLCLDVLGGLVHVGLGKPVENLCCPVLQGLLELEAAVCLCTAIRLKVLNINIFIPLALNILIICDKDPPPGYLCPAL